MAWRPRNPPTRVGFVPGTVPSKKGSALQRSSPRRWTSWPPGHSAGISFQRHPTSPPAACPTIGIVSLGHALCKGAIAMPATPTTGLLLDTAHGAGFSPDGLRRAFTLLDDWIGQGVLPGAAVLVACGGRVA